MCVCVAWSFFWIGGCNTASLGTDLSVAMVAATKILHWSHPLMEDVRIKLVSF